ncbi:MAG: hypothetical protein PVJ27_09520, partial [Candidatus Brocadiaceae bacterium]
MRVEVGEATSRRELLEFIKFPYSLYADDPHYVPRLLRERKEFFADANPIFDFTRVRYLLARDSSGGVLGRVSAHVNQRHNDFWGERTGFFGFFECVEDARVAEALMDRAEQWLASQDMVTVRGPLNFSTNQECGFLAEGFDSPPVFMMPYTKPYYLEMMEGMGYAKAKDLLAYDYHYPGEIPRHLERFCRRVQERTPALVRTVDMADFSEEIRRAFSVYNRAWSEN